jgi:hypothetical protein
MKTCKKCNLELADDRYRLRKGHLSATCRNCLNRNDIPKTIKKNYLPVGPFREWCQGRIKEEETKLLFSNVWSVDRKIRPERKELAGMSSPQHILSQDLGISDRRLFGVLNQQQYVTIDFVDRVLTNYGGSTMLDDLYPYEEPDAS